MIDINNLGVPRQRAENIRQQPPPPIGEPPPALRKRTLEELKNFQPPPRPPSPLATNDEVIRRLKVKIIMLEGGLTIAFIFIAFLLGVWFGVIL